MKYLFTERAHLACPNMCFGIAVTLEKAFDKERVEEADAFLAAQTGKVRAKILYNIQKASYTNDPKIFKKLENTDIWEFRTLFDNIQYRLLAFWDKRNGQRTLVIATHGFVKKSQKTPPQEIHHAESIKNIYFNQK